MHLRYPIYDEQPISSSHRRQLQMMDPCVQDILSTADPNDFCIKTTPCGDRGALTVCQCMNFRTPADNCPASVDVSQICVPKLRENLRQRDVPSCETDDGFCSRIFGSA